MPPGPLLHEREDFADLIRIVADERGLLPALVEKDYWIMHCLYGLGAQGFGFELKGGTSLSKGFGIIQRFSEDIDIRIDPACAPFEVFTVANQTKLGGQFSHCYMPFTVNHFGGDASPAIAL